MTPPPPPQPAPVAAVGRVIMSGTKRPLPVAVAVVGGTAMQPNKRQAMTVVARSSVPLQVAPHPSAVPTTTRPPLRLASPQQPTTMMTQATATAVTTAVTTALPYVHTSTSIPQPRAMTTATIPTRPPIPIAVTRAPLHVAPPRAPARASKTPSKKRPYRRSKRGKFPCDKSTVTTASPTVHTPVNVYDAVLGEAEDLLNAAMEAQAMGRLKMASAYSLLLHARLVGLGKRFDRSNVKYNNPSAARRLDTEDSDAAAPTVNTALPVVQGAVDGTAPTSGTTEVAKAEAVATATAATTTTTPGTVATQSMTATAPPAPQTTGQPIASASNANTTATAATQPPDLKDLPVALQQLTSILPSNIEMDTAMIEYLARAAVTLHHQRTGRKQSEGGLLSSPMHPSGMMPTAPPAATQPGTIAWTPAEEAIVRNAKGKHKPEQIVMLLRNSKTLAQVKAYLNNRSKTATASSLDDTPKRGGRGRKPPTAAMNTLPNANLDARSLLRGAQFIK